MTTDPANQYASPYLGMGNNPVRYFDERGDSIKIDIPMVSTDYLDYHNKIDELKGNWFFNTFYSYLENSNEVYTIRMGIEPKGAGHFNAGTKEVVFKTLDYHYVIAQELFHAFQNAIGYDPVLNTSAAEAEGNIVSHMLAWDLSLPYTGDIAFATESIWGKDLLFNVMGMYYVSPLPSEEVINSIWFESSFNSAARIDFFKLNESISSPSYVSPNSYIGTLAIQKVYSLSNQFHFNF